MTFGITSTGFIVKPLETILAELETDERANTGRTDLDTSAESLVGQINAAVAPKLAELWALAASIDRARDPANATKATLEALAQITGTVRAPASKGSARLKLSVDAHRTIPAGSVAFVDGEPGNRWVTATDAINISDDPVDITIAAAAETAGAFEAPAHRITKIATPVSGWLAVTNPTDAQTGTDADDDAALRVRREQELARPGTGTLAALRADVLAHTWRGQHVMSACLVEENDSDFRDALGRPPHSIEVVVQPFAWVNSLPGTEFADLANQLAVQLWRSKPAGVGYYAPPGGGTTTLTVVDSMGGEQRVAFSSPSSVAITTAIAVVADPAQYPGDDALRAAIQAYGAGLTMGSDVVRMRVVRAIIDTVPGVLDITALYLNRPGQAAREQNITLDRREVAVFDTGAIAVSS